MTTVVNAESRTWTAATRNDVRGG